MTETRIVSVIPRLVATFLSLGFLFVIYLIFDRFDWGYPLAKLACFAALFGSIVGLHLLKSRSDASPAPLWVEIGILLFLLNIIFLAQVPSHARRALTPPTSDIGFTTVHAVNIVVSEGENPYSRTDINSEQTNLPSEYHGFHYGPFMIVGYLPSGYLGPYAYKMMSILYVGITAVLLIFLAARPNKNSLENVSDALFVLVAYFMSGRFWYELLIEGVNDVFHIMLLLAGFLCLKYGRVFLAGFFTGLSISAKFAPGVFAVPFMPVRQRNFWLGLVLGLTPYLPFFFSDPAGVWRNAVWLRVIIPHNSTSLYSITPPEFHWIFAIVMIASCLFAAWWAIRRELTFEQALIGFTLLMIVADVTQKQVHLNHLLWFLPFLALLFSEYRSRIAAVIGGVRRSETASV